MHLKGRVLENNFAKGKFDTYAPLLQKNTESVVVRIMSFPKIIKRELMLKMLLKKDGVNQKWGFVSKKKLFHVSVFIFLDIYVSFKTLNRFFLTLTSSKQEYHDWISKQLHKLGITYDSHLRSYWPLTNRFPSLTFRKGLV